MSFNIFTYDAVRALYERRDPIDFVTLCDELESRKQLEDVGGAAYITQLINAVPSAIHVEAYGHIVEQAAIRRRLLSAASEIAKGEPAPASVHDKVDLYHIDHFMQYATVLR